MPGRTITRCSSELARPSPQQASLAIRRDEAGAGARGSSSYCGGTSTWGRRRRSPGSILLVLPLLLTAQAGPCATPSGDIDVDAGPLLTREVRCCMAPGDSPAGCVTTLRVRDGTTHDVPHGELLTLPAGSWQGIRGRSCNAAGCSTEKGLTEMATPCDTRP